MVYSEGWGLGALSFYWIIIGFKKVGGCCCMAPGLLGHFNRWLNFVPMLFFACGCRGWEFCSCFPVISSPGDISSEEENGSHI